MKTIPVALISLVLFGGTVHAQRTSPVIRDTVMTQVSRDTAVDKDVATTGISTMIPISQMIQTKNYRWDARVIGDSAIVVYDWREKLKSLKSASAKN